MCGVCGCSSGTVTVTKMDIGLENKEQGGDSHTHSHDDHHHDHSHDHSHDHGHDHSHHHHHDHEHGHDHGPGHSHTHMHRASESVELEAAILGKNDKLAAENRGWLKAKNILALNLVSSPGSGKTTLLERTLTDLKDKIPMAVIEGDQETLNDAERIRATGTACVQVNTGTGCHLEADMVQKGMEQLDPQENSLLLIENVGNLVCPALFDLGERAKVAILSVTEGADKPAKYPHMIAASDILVINKIDLLPYVTFDVDAAIQAARDINPAIKVFQVSATNGEGLDVWYDWLLAEIGVSGTIQAAE
ncbi:MAG TPA: hydrogenase accessory protein HypB [Rhodospirillaceae bacterium]|nr:hydrogenase accessory protein HypB [Magnetovibrio sp.]MBO6521077.1 hydrogenase nickel incorporation protein HypB [Rhodospirillales bacterium]HCS70010.1 hydrogenase accessory protein HypB [Rhodospirillaceae bacterium]|tara:strand:+ start:379 stop:1293 length:915 start_codon:yes stop_codon:yes gene_type:complete